MAGLPLRVVLDYPAAPPEPDPGPWVIEPADQFGRRLRLDAMLMASIRVPGPLCLVTGV